MIHALFILLALVAGFFAVRFTLAAQAENKTKSSWPGTPGEVVSAGYQQVSRGGEGGGEFPRFMMHYSYDVAGQPHNGSLYSDNKKSFSALAAKYPAKTPLTVYYNPQIPQHSDLREPLGATASWNTQTGAIMLYAAAFLLLVFGIVVH